MKISKSNGVDEEDYDTLWADLQAFFSLYTYTEEQKISLLNAHLGGEARRFVQEEDLKQIKKVNQLNELLKSTFSRKLD